MCGNCTPFLAQTSPNSTELLDRQEIDYTAMEKESVESSRLLNCVDNNIFEDDSCNGFRDECNPERDKPKRGRHRDDATPVINGRIEDVVSQLFIDVPSPSLSTESAFSEELSFSGSLPSSPITMTTAVTPRQPKTPRQSSTENKATLETPLDFSFLNITDLSELESEDPRALLGKNAHRDNEGKYNCKCLKLNNNVIAELKGLMPALENLFVDPSILSWIDLSFNELTRIDDALCDFPNLQILYLHGNQINDIKEVDKLGGIKNLKKLCLHGNPIETTKNYRWYVLSIIPQLQSLDMSGITKADRVTASTWKSTNPTKKKKKRSSDD